MGVTGTTATKVEVVVYPARITSLKTGTLTADGSEQDIIEYVGVARTVGYVDLHNMKGGDTTRIRQYMKLKPGGSYQKYADEVYAGVQDVPVIYVTAKESDFGVKITLQQTAGAMRDYDYNFLKEY